MPMTFSLYDAATGGTLIAGPLGASVEVVNGTFTVNPDFSADAFDGDQRWLEITVDGTTLAPRQEVTAAPYALQTRGLFVDGNGNVGVGTSEPAGRLHVAGDMKIEDNNTLEFGAGTPGKQLDAGKIGYQIWSDGLDIVGAGVEQGARRIHFWAEGGAIVDGRVGINVAAPQAQLDVAGDGRMASLELTGGANAHGVVGWGQNGDGQSASRGEAMVAVDASDSVSVGMLPDGTLMGWGWLGSSILENLPSGSFTSFSLGSDHGLALRADGTVVGWGSNADGRLEIPEGTYTAVAAGLYHSVALRADGTLVAVGNEADGAVPAPEGTYIAVAAGSLHNVAIRTDGTLVAWGSNWAGQCDVPEGTFVAVSAGEGHSLAIRTDGNLEAWGDNSYGQSTAPDGTFTAISAGKYHNLAIRADGSLVTWGDNCLEALSVPPGTFQAIAAGDCYSLAVPTSFGGPALRLQNDAAFKPGTNTWTISSDIRLKKNIHTLESSLEKLLQLRGVTFEWRNPASQGGRTGTEMGMIADEVEKVFPQWVGRDSRGFRTLSIGGFEGLTAEAMRELRAEKDRQLAEQQVQLNEVKVENAELRERLARIESELAGRTADGTR
jgi:hypothetical protein